MRREPIFNVPQSVLWLLGAFIAVHVARNLLPEDWDATLLLSLAFIPARYAGHAAELPGGVVALFTSPVTHMFVHGSLTHLVINGAWLLAFGAAIAKRAGGARFLAFSLFCGLVAIATYWGFHIGGLDPVVGASGAISGQMAGALRFFLPAVRRGDLALFRTHPEVLPLASVAEMLSHPQTLTVIGIWVALNFLFGFGGSIFAEGAAIAWEAHLGGFLAGLFGYGLFDRQAPPPPPEEGETL